MECDIYSPRFTVEEGMRWGVKKIAQGQEESEGGGRIQAQLEPDSAPGFKL